MLSSVKKSIWTKDSISIEDLDIQIESTKLLKNTSFSISQGERIALLGRNGCGKSTLFHWLNENKDPSWSVYEVAQELPASELSILQIVLSAHLERGSLYSRIAELELKEEMTNEELVEYTSIQDQLNAMKAEADPPRVKKILAGLGFQDIHAPLKTFSGGWRARVALAQGLFMEPDLLMLDEPTNHLDLEAVLWLISFCEGWKKTLLIISHNVGFVREVANKIWHIQSGNLNQYKCKYSKFIKQEEIRLQKQKKDWEQLEKDLAALRKKNTPANKKEAELLLAKRTAEGVSRPEKPYSPKFFLLEKEDEPIGESAFLTCESVSLGYGDAGSILENVSFSIYPGSRIALVGSNGSGKSTFLKYVEGSLEPREGSSNWKKNLRICKFDQHFYSSLPEDKTPLEFLQKDKITVDTVRKVLGASGLAGEAHSRKIGTLSGGQKARVYFASISIQSPNILLLDEPTNHLDMETISGLREAVKTFPGAVVVISHDIDFLEDVSEEVWLVRDRTVQQLRGGLEEYIDSVAV